MYMYIHVYHSMVHTHLLIHEINILAPGAHTKLIVGGGGVEPYLWPLFLMLVVWIPSPDNLINV